jgi:uncharacterized membrane protein
MLLTIGFIVLVLWLFGFAVHIGGTFIHLLLIVSLILIILHFVTGSAGRHAER